MPVWQPGALLDGVLCDFSKCVQTYSLHVSGLGLASSLHSMLYTASILFSWTSKDHKFPDI